MTLNVCLVLLLNLCTAANSMELPSIIHPKDVISLETSKQTFTERLRGKMMTNRLLYSHGFTGVGRMIRIAKPLMGKCAYIKGSYTRVFIMDEHCLELDEKMNLRKIKEYDVIIIGTKQTPIAEVRRSRIRLKIDRVHECTQFECERIGNFRRRYFATSS